MVGWYAGQLFATGLDLLVSTKLSSSHDVRMLNGKKREEKEKEKEREKRKEKEKEKEKRIERSIFAHRALSIPPVDFRELTRMFPKASFKTRNKVKERET